MNYIIQLLLMMLFSLVSCSNPSNAQALILSINRNDYSSNMLLLNSTDIAPISKIDSIDTTYNIEFITLFATPIVYSQIQATNYVRDTTTWSSTKTKNRYITYNRKYKNIPKGSYTGGNTYTVKYGDTLFYIAWITGNDCNMLAHRNNIKAPYNLYIGQILWVNNINNVPIKSNNIPSVTQVMERNTNIKFVRKNNIIISSNSTTMHPINSHSAITNNIFSDKKKTTMSIMSKPAVWLWPTKGRVIQSNNTTLNKINKGVSIVGSKGQAIVATSNGRVVYAGNALRGYGNLIIIKHNNDYLSAYAHNDTILVKEQQKVKAGQKIATMGSSGTNLTCLHFEIRYKGKSVNPLHYLSQNK